MIEDKAKQGTIPWRKAHLGIPTASDFADIMPTPAAFRQSVKTGKPPTMPASREHYRAKKLVERMLGRPWDSADGQVPTLSALFSIKRGRELENEACMGLVIELQKRQVRGALRRCGLFLTDDRQIGASPDRILMVDGREECCEVKCPLAHNHMEYLLQDLSDPEMPYYAQVQGQLFVTGFQRAHFMSYHPRMPAKYVMFERDEAYIAELEKQLRSFLVELKEAEAKARTLGKFKPYNGGK